MGNWGMGVSSNDTFADIYGSFCELHDKGLIASEISNKLISDNQDIINNTEEANNFWFALAKAQHEHKQLSPEIFEKVKTIIETDADIRVFKALGATDKQLIKRKVELNKFLEYLQIEQKRTRINKRKRILPVFEKGDCLTFKLTNGNYGGAIVLETIKNSTEGYSLIVLTRINQLTKPTQNDFKKAEVLIINYANWQDKPRFFWYLPIRHKKVSDLITTVSNMPIKRNYDVNNSPYSFVGDFDIHAIDSINSQFESEKTKPKPKERLFVSQFFKKKWFKFW